MDDATCIRALKVYFRYTQNNAIDFIYHVLEKFLFRIHTVRIGNGHELQAKFHWHVEHRGIRHVYIKPRNPNLNGKVERSHSTDEQGFYQLLSNIDDRYLNKKLAEWETFYNFHRLRGGLNRKNTFEILRERLQ